jgi:serine/threonine protein kinase
MTQEEFFKRYKYSIRTDKVGGGAFGTVYKAFDEVLNREVAIKVSEVKIMGGKEFSLKDEFDAIKDVPVHPNIANYEELVTLEMPNGIFDYAIMQFYKDGNLSSFIKSNPTLAQKEQVALDLLEGIHHLHKHSVVHRDLKPGNILIVKRGAKTIPVITDFGLSKNAKMEGQSRFSNSFGGGTLKYSSPEQLKAERLRLNTDLWAYGVIVYEIFTGKNLFMAQQITGASAEAEKEIYEQIIGVDVSEMIKELPSKWQEVVKQCLVRDGAKRIKSTQALKDLILKDETFTKSAASTNDDKTLISEVVSEESMNAQTIVNDKQPTQKEAVKKESVTEKAPPIKKENTKTASFSEYNSEFKKKKVVPFLKLAGVLVGLAIISTIALVWFKMFSNNNWEQAQELNTEQSYSIYIENNPEGEHVANAKENLLWFSVKDDESIDSLDVYLNIYPNGKMISKAFEIRDWLQSKESNTVESYNVYLEKHSNGNFRVNAEKQISFLNDENASKEEKIWNSAKKSNTITSYTAYIKAYKNGKHIKDANSKIKELKKKAEGSSVDNYKKGKVFYDKGEYLDAAKYFLVGANQGHKESQYYLSYSLRRRIWDLGSQTKGSFPKQLLVLGEGRLIPTIWRWMKKSANQGYVPAMGALGDFYKGITYNNDTYNKDLKKAEEWYLKAANTGDDKGIYSLVLFYKYDLKNIEKAKYWIEKFPKNKNSQTMYRYGTFEDRPGYSLENEHEWLLKSAKLGHYHACKDLGWNYRKGTEFLSRDLDQAFYWYKKIAENDKDSFDNDAGWQGMAIIYENPEFRNYNLSKALEYYNLVLKNKTSKNKDQFTTYSRSRKSKLEAQGVK